MAIHQIVKTFNDPEVKIMNDIRPGIIGLPCPVTGTLKKVRIIVNNSSATESRWNLRYNGVGLFSGTDRPNINSGALDVSKTGLSTAVVQGVRFMLDLEVLTGGNINHPIDLMLEIDDGIADIPSGGSNDHVLTKASGSDYDIEWAAAAGGGASSLDDLSDVDLTTPPTDGQTLVYDNANSVFKAGTVTGSGDVVGPGSATDNGIALFDGTTGKLIQDSTAIISTDGTLAADSDTKVPSEKAVKTYADAVKPVEAIGIACSDETTDLTTGTAKATFRMPYAFTLTAVRANVNTAPAGSVLTVDINEGGTTILSTKLTIDASEKTSTTAATPAVISDASLADDAEITIDIDGVGSSTAGKGLKVWLIGRRT